MCYRNGVQTIACSLRQETRPRNKQVHLPLPKSGRNLLEVDCCYIVVNHFKLCDTMLMLQSGWRSKSNPLLPPGCLSHLCFQPLPTCHGKDIDPFTILKHVGLNVPILVVSYNKLDLNLQKNTVAKLTHSVKYVANGV